MRGLMTLAQLHTERRDMSSYPMIEALKYDQQSIMVTKASNVQREYRFEETEQHGPIL
jgi:hypothetical protein